MAESKSKYQARRPFVHYTRAVKNAAGKDVPVKDEVRVGQIVELDAATGEALVKNGTVIAEPTLRSNSSSVAETPRRDA